MSFFKSLSIKQKMFAYILLPIIVIFLATFTFIFVDFQSIVKTNTKEFINSEATGYSLQIQNELNYFIEFNRFLKQNFESFDRIPMENRRRELSSLMEYFLNRNPKILSIWSIWELNSIDSLESTYANKPGSTVLGNFRYLYYRDNGVVKLSDYIEQDPNNVFNGKLYNATKNKKREVIVTHFYLDYNQTSKNKTLQTNIVMPLYQNRKFLGVVGVDLELESIHNTIQNIDHFSNSQIFLFSNNGMCISSPNNEDRGKQVKEIFPDINDSYKLDVNILNGRYNTFFATNNAENHYFTFTPISIGKTKEPWSLLIKMPYSYIKNQTRQSIKLAIWGSLIGITLIILILIYISDNISKPLIQLRKKMDYIGKGALSEDYIPSKMASSEIKDIARSYSLITSGLKNSTQFAENIKRGNLDSDFNLLSSDDKMGKALLDMRAQLKDSKEQQSKREEEERKRFWSSEGLSKLNEILRKNENSENYIFNILSFLVNYIDANQGGIFLRDDSDKTQKFILKAFYAYNRRKFLEKSFELGEGLVGNCAIEKQTTYFTEIPENYIQVTSGLGGTNPRSLILVPLKLENKVLGIIEVASFNNLEQYQIKFLESASLSIASAINMLETNKNTSKLLERTQQQAKEMAVQEEEMRQNMEELKATQEESTRKIQEFEALISELEKEKKELMNKTSNR